MEKDRKKREEGERGEGTNCRPTALELLKDGPSTSCFSGPQAHPAVWKTPLSQGAGQQKCQLPLHSRCSGC